MIKVPRLWAQATTLEFNPYLGRQIIPMALKVLDNFVLGIAGLRFHHRIEELTPHGLSTASRSVSDPTLVVTMVMVISVRNAHPLTR